ncbi:MAG TPA: dockerin type I domain-containing protein, partial [Phycisphaerae bacterium]|nr:dockerin type I domain-containing protein [Phycisphaerae bacterium]
RSTGGEYYQSRWVRMNNLTIATPQTWQAGEQVTVADGTDSLPMMLSAVGDFNSYSPPVGAFDVVALFDQEPRPLNIAASRMDHYRLWVKRMEHILPPGTPFLVTAVSRMTHGSAGAFDIDVSMPGVMETRQAGPSLLVVRFDRPVTGFGGLDASDVTVSSGSVTGLAVNDGELSVTLSGVANAANLTISFPGIISVANGAAATQSLCFGVLRGDVTGDRQVSSLDLIGVRARLGRPVTAANFRYDVRADGAIGSLDLIVVRTNLGRTLSTACP